MGQGSAVTGFGGHTPKSQPSLAGMPAAGRGEHWHRACMNFCSFSGTRAWGRNLCPKHGAGSTGVCSGQRSLKRDAWPFRKGRWTLRALSSLWAVSQVPWWHLGAVALPSSSPASRRGMVGMPNHLGRCDQIAPLKGAKPVWLPYCAMINKGFQLFFSINCE